MDQQIRILPHLSAWLLRMPRVQRRQNGVQIKQTYRLDTPFQENGRQRTLPRTRV